MTCKRPGGDGAGADETKLNVLWCVVVPNGGLSDDCESLARLGEAFPSGRLREAAASRLVWLRGRHGAVGQACSTGCLELCKILTAGMTRRDFDPLWLHAAAKSGGGVLMLEWIVTRFDARRSDVVGDGTVLAMEELCALGLEEGARWFAEKFRITGDDMRLGRCFRNAVGAGRVQAARWLESVGLVEELRKEHRCCCPDVSWIEGAAEHGGVDGMQTVLDAIGNTDAQGQKKALHKRLRCDMWAACCRRGSVSLMKWGKDALGLSPKFMAPYLNDTCSSGSVEAVTWFVEEFDISPDKLRPLIKDLDYFDDKADWDNRLKHLLANACHSVPLVQWLLDWAEVDRKMLLKMKTASRVSLRPCGGPALMSLVERFSLNRNEACGSRKQALIHRLCLADLETAVWLGRRFSLDLPGIVRHHLKTIVLFHLAIRDTEALGKLLSLELFPWHKLEGSFLESIFSAVCCLRDVTLARSVAAKCDVPKGCLHLQLRSCRGGIESLIGHTAFVDHGAKGSESRASSALRSAMRKVNVFRTLCKEGDLCMVRWLADTFSITKEDVFSCEVGAKVNDERLVFLACVSGNLDLVQWLASHFSLAEEDFHTGAALQGAAESGSFPLVSWLVSSFVYTYGDINCILSSRTIFLDLIQAMTGQH